MQGRIDSTCRKPGQRGASHRIARGRRRLKTATDGIAPSPSAPNPSSRADVGPRRIRAAIGPTMSGRQTKINCASRPWDRRRVRHRLKVLQSFPPYALGNEDTIRPEDTGRPACKANGFRAPMRGRTPRAMARVTRAGAGPRPRPLAGRRAGPRRIQRRMEDRSAERAR